MIRVNNIYEVMLVILLILILVISIFCLLCVKAKVTLAFACVGSLCFLALLVWRAEVNEFADITDISAYSSPVEYYALHAYKENGDDIVLYEDEERDMIILLNKDFNTTSYPDGTTVNVGNKFEALIVKDTDIGFIIRVPDPGYVVAGLSGSPIYLDGDCIGYVSAIYGEAEISCIGIK